MLDKRNWSILDGLFPQCRLQLMRGGHARQQTAQPGDITIATLDVASIDEGTTEPTAALDNPARDYIVCTIFTISHYTESGPVYTAVDVFYDQGKQHFKQINGTPSLADQLLAYLNHWQVSTIIGEGLLNWLAAALGTASVTPFKFTYRSKAQLGVDFLALVETNRFKYWREEHEYDDALWSFDPGRPLETHLQWFVLATTKISTPTGAQFLHDDRLISAALIAQADKLIREGHIHTGHAKSAITPAYDPFPTAHAKTTIPSKISQIGNRDLFVSAAN